MALVGKNIEKWDMQFVTENFLFHINETTQLRLYKIVNKGRPPVNPEASGCQHPEDCHHILSG